MLRAVVRPQRCAKRSRLADCVTRAAASFPRIGSRVGGCRNAMWFRPSAAVSIMRTGRCSTRSTTTVHSSRARCLRPASRAAIATSRMAPSFGRRMMASAGNAMLPTSMRRSNTATMRGRAHRSAAPPVICPHAPTWGSIGGTIMASVFPDLICPSNSARPTPAMTATPTLTMGGCLHRELARPQPQGLSELHRRIARSVDRTSRCGSPTRRDRRRSPGASDCPRERTDRARPARLARQRRHRPGKAGRSRPYGAHRCPRYA